MTATIEREYFSPPEVAKLLGIKHEKVLGWIRTHELKAVNLATSQAGRPRWRINREALDSFLARRAVTPPPKPRRRRNKTDVNVISYC